ncbi:MAG: hypothetical protein NC221_08870, partial [Duncaniella sp.]|nr:hypothetical protein [Duncaniella sp.]
MKLNKWIYGAMAVGMLAACSNDDLPTNGGGEVVTQDGNYVSVSINLPTTPSSRAANDNYDDGLASEYKVFSGCLVIFSGESESEATFAAAYDLQALNPNDDLDNDNITTRFLKTVELKGLSYEKSDDLYGFVMLNYKDIAIVTDEQGLIVDGEELTEASTYKDAFLKATSNLLLSGKDGNEYNFFMCNAPMSNKQGATIKPEDLEVKTLVKLDKTAIKPTQEEAEEAVAASFYVERGVAKAQLIWNAKQIDAKEGQDGVKTTNGETPSFAVIGWTLDATENTSYIGRNVQDTNWWSYTSSLLNPANYRFVGSVPMGTIGKEDPENVFRTYWCLDPSYSMDNPNLLYKKFDTEDKAAIDEIFKPSDRILYCHENTFDVEHQDYNNTTRAVIQTTLKFGDNQTGTFYVLDGKKNEIYTDWDKVASYPLNTIIGSRLIKEVFDDACREGKFYDTSIVLDLVKVTFTRSKEDGIKRVKSISIDKTKADPEIFDISKLTLTEDQIANLISDANSYVIEEYIGGNCYYEVRFMHFGTEPDYDTEGDVTAGNLAPWQPASDNVI